MSKLYISQQIDLTIDCELTGLDFADAASAVINYTKPDTSTGTLTPGVLNTVAKTIGYQILAATNNQAGTWILQPVATIGAVPIPGTSFDMVIHARYT